MATYGLERSLNQVLSKGRDLPAGLYPLTTRNDVEQQVGYDGPDKSLWPITGRITSDQPTGITDSRNETWVNYSNNPLVGRLPRVGPSGGPHAIGAYDWPIEAPKESSINGSARPKNVRPPHVRSVLTDAMRKDAVDLPLRGNLAYNEWENAMPQVFEQGNGFAISGPAYRGSYANVDTF